MSAYGKTLTYMFSVKFSKINNLQRLYR